MGIIAKSINLGKKESYLEWPGRYPYAKPLGLGRSYRAITISCKVRS